MVWLLEGVVLALFQKGPWVNADSPLQQSAVPAIAVCPLSVRRGVLQRHGPGWPGSLVQGFKPDRVLVGFSHVGGCPAALLPVDLPAEPSRVGVPYRDER